MSNMVGFIDSPDRRGTMSLVWTSLLTIFLCTWTSLHVDVPKKSSKWGGLLGKLGKWLGVLFVPEGTAAIASNELYAAILLRRDVRAHGSCWEGWTLKQSFLVLMKGTRSEESWDCLPGIIATDKAVALENNRRPRLGLHHFPSNAEIDARCKSDGLSKVIAICQAVWFLVGIINRLAHHLPISLLEAMTVGYFVCGLACFAFWYEKPHDLTEPFDIHVDHDGSGGGGPIPAGIEPVRPGYLYGYSSDGSLTFAVITLLMLGAFEGIHLAEWNYQFPSFAEAWVWRASIIGSLIFWFVFVVKVWQGRGNNFSTTALGSVYVLCRLVTLVEGFISLRSVPDRIYDTPSWLASLPHVGS